MKFKEGSQLESKNIEKRILIEKDVQKIMTVLILVVAETD